MCFDIENDGLEAHLGSRGGLPLAESSSVLEWVRAIQSKNGFSDFQDVWMH